MHSVSGIGQIYESVNTDNDVLPTAMLRVFLEDLVCCFQSLLELASLVEREEFAEQRRLFWGKNTLRWHWQCRWRHVGNEGERKGAETFTEC